jgi:peptidoglycan-associated lipoprotein
VSSEPAEPAPATPAAEAAAAPLPDAPPEQAAALPPDAPPPAPAAATPPPPLSPAQAFAPPPPPPPPPPPKPTLEQRLVSDIQDAYFDYDKSDIRSDARDALTKDADALKSILADFPSATIMLEGNCDERGSAEYNIGLGDRRASSAKEFLQQLGVSADRLKSISYGKDKPVCSEANETCWQKNRHVHFAPGQ